MFRFICISWSPDSSSQSELAIQLDEAFLSSGSWEPALRTRGLHVYMLGSQRGVNTAYRLPNDSGTVLGRVFRRSETKHTGDIDITLTQHEGELIVDTEAKTLIEEFWGRYVAFIRTPDGAHKVLRDPSGSLPCYQTSIDGVTVAFSWLEDILVSPIIRRMLHVNWEAVAAHMYFGNLGGRDTGIKGVFQVLPGKLTLLASGPGRTKSLWSAVDFARRPNEQGYEAAAELLRETVISTAQKWAKCYRSVLVRLSGGLDSTIVLSSISAGFPSSRVVCLNYHSPGSDSDERKYARLAAKRCGVLLIEQERDTTFDLRQVLNVARTPAPSSYVGRLGTGRIDAATAAAHEATVMFTGAGGDQVFFEISCNWPAADFLHQNGFGKGFFSASLDAARLGNTSVWKTIRRAISNQSSLPDLSHGVGEYLALLSNDAARSSVTHIDNYIHPDLIGAGDLPIGKFNQTRWLIHPIDAFDPYMRESAPEIVNPLLSQPVVEICLQTPTYIHTHGGRGRSLARHAFEAHIPPEINRRRSKGGMDEHIRSILSKNLSLARELVLDGQLIKHGLIDRRAAEAALTGSPSTTKDAYVGEIHNCVAIEAWLASLDNMKESLTN